MRAKGTIEKRYLLAAVIVLALGIALSFFTRKSEPNSYADLQLQAAISMEKAEKYLASRMAELDIAIEDEDLNRTYLIGPEFSELTSTPGAPDAKRTALNPDFAAAMIRYFEMAGLKKGDTLAIGTSGSFPGFVIAVTVAAKEMGLNVKIIASCGSSMHGATRPEFTVFDILSALKEGGFADFDLLAVSAGGNNDEGGSVLEGVIYEGTKELAHELCRKTGCEVIAIADLAENIAYRLSLYGEDVDLFINIGGAATNCGVSAYTLNFPQGLVLDPPTIPTISTRGLNYEFASRGVPVLNLLNVKQLSKENGIPYDPVPLAKPGTGGLYSGIEYSHLIVFSTIVIVLIILSYGAVKSGSKRKINE